MIPDFKNLKDELISSLISLTNSSKFLKAEEVVFLRSELDLMRKFNSLGEKANDLIINTTNIGFQVMETPQSLFLNDNTDIGFKILIDSMDNFYEKADIILDAALLSKKKQANPDSAGNDFQTSQIIFQPAVKPQIHFKDKIDNTNSPWIPIIRSKPNATQPLNVDNQVSVEMKNHLSTMSSWSEPHPYKFEIENITYLEEQFLFQTPIEYENLEKTPLIWVDSLEGLELLIKKLLCAKEFAVDLEHHDYRSFQGFTCLIQISTRCEDYIIDALRLRHEIYRLNEVFTNPSIIKVFHGADMDVIWLQRDFGVYIVNLFDTFHASHCLELAKHSYAFLIDIYCGIQADKKYQRADWRQRPLSKEMINYARSDTHYLLYIYDIMRNEMIEKSDDLVKITLEKSRQTCLKIYEKPIYDSENGEGSGGWKNLLRKHPEALNMENFAVFRAIHGWRDHVARLEDESTAYVMPNHILFKLCRFMPTAAHEVISGCSPVPPLVRVYAGEISKLIEETLKNFRERDSFQSTTAITVPNTLIPNLEEKNIELGKPFVHSRKVSACFGNLFSSNDSPKSIFIAAKIERDLLLVAPRLDIVEVTSSITVEEDLKEENDLKIVKEKTFDHNLKRKEDITDITSVPIASKKIKEDRFDYLKAQIDIEKGDNAVASSIFDPSIKSVTSRGAKKKKGRSGRL